MLRNYVYEIREEADFLSRIKHKRPKWIGRAISHLQKGQMFEKLLYKRDL